MEEFNQDLENLVNEEYRVWKKASPYLYDLLIAHELEDWPSLTVQWLPQVEELSEGLECHHLIFGTHADQTSYNYLIQAKVLLPTTKEAEDTFIAKTPKIEVEAKIVHQGQINRARYCPQRPNLVATKTRGGEIHLFDLTNRPLRPNKAESQPDLRLFGHDKEGYGMSWNPNRQGLLLSAGYDEKILVWDIEDNTEMGRRLHFLNELHFHNGCIEDVQWHPDYADVFGSVGGDRTFALWDTRGWKKHPVLSSLSHIGEIYSLDWSPFNEYLYLTGSEDKQIALWDLRFPTNRVHTLTGHHGQIHKVQWSPFNQAICASASADRKIIIWDLSKSGEANTAYEHRPEVLFVHGGHRSKVTDFDWNRNRRWGIASTEENNLMHMWQFREEINQLHQQKHG